MNLFRKIFGDKNSNEKENEILSQEHFFELKYSQEFILALLHTLAIFLDVISHFGDLFWRFKKMLKNNKTPKKKCEVKQNSKNNEIVGFE